MDRRSRNAALKKTDAAHVVRAIDVPMGSRTRSDKVSHVRIARRSANKMSRVVHDAKNYNAEVDSNCSSNYA